MRLLWLDAEVVSKYWTKGYIVGRNTAFDADFPQSKQVADG
jgi:hypothetical protein